MIGQVKDSIKSPPSLNCRSAMSFPAVSFSFFSSTMGFASWAFSTTGAGFASETGLIFADGVD